MNPTPDTPRDTPRHGPELPNPAGNRRQLVRLVFERQPLHWLALVLLLVAVGLVYQRLADAHTGSWLGISADTWFVVAIVIPIAHQHWVLFGWRLELYHGWWSRRFGDAAFDRFSLGFEVLILSRLLSILGLAVATRGTVAIPLLLQVPVVTVLLALTIWAGVSVVRYFGFARARGADHFFAEYRRMPLCREGIFKFIPNAMYTVGFSPLWALAVACESLAALLAASFAQIYIWVHYFCTEVPDMNRIYGQTDATGNEATADQAVLSEKR